MEEEKGRKAVIKPWIKEEEENEEGDWEEIRPALPDIWLPKSISDELEGAIVSLGEGQYGLYAVIHCGDGREVRTPSHRILQSRLEDCKVGDRVKIIYQGKTRLTSGRWAENYIVLRKKVTTN